MGLNWITIHALTMNTALALKLQNSNLTGVEILGDSEIINDSLANFSILIDAFFFWNGD